MIMCKNNAEGSVCHLELRGNSLICTTHTGENSAELCGRLYDGTLTYTTISGNRRIYNMPLDFNATNQSYTDSYREPDILSDATSADRDITCLSIIGIVGNDEKTAIEIWGEQLQNDFNNMAVSVAKYKGFYIGRYEVGENGACRKNQLVLTAATTSSGNYIGGNMWYGIYNNIRSTSQEIINRDMIWRKSILPSN